MANRFRITIGVLLASCLLTCAAPAEERTPPPTPAQIKRAEKVVQSLSLRETATADQVAAIISGQYAGLSAIQETRDTAIRQAQTLKSSDKVASQDALNAAAARALEEQKALHTRFLSTLARHLTPEQIDRVKDGMTYGVLPLTYRVYQEMLPGLTQDQKAQILSWLTEARELAMDGGSSEEKHRIFGRYKGRINNYLSAAGIDMKHAEREMLERNRLSKKP
jgi:hypothetical protein